MRTTEQTEPTNRVLIALWALLVLSLTSSLGLAQNAKDYYTEGNIRAKNQEYESAIENYSIAISMDSNYADAYYNRGTARVRLKQYDSAIVDFGKTIKLKPDFGRAYANRGLAKLEAEHPADAIADFTHAIELDSGVASVYFLRAQARMGSGDHDGGCSDLRAAKALGDTRADRFLRQYCTDSASLAVLGTPERVEVAWPKSEGWTIRDTQDAGGVSVVELTRTGETLDNWKEIATMTTYRGLAQGNVEDQMKQLFAQAKQTQTDAKLTVLARDTTGAHPWIIFKIEVDAKEPESQVWQIIHGTNDLFVNFWGVHQPTVTAEQAKKWMAVFKSAKIVTK